jgi:membrane-bound serine protease (ClpP class)
LKIVQVRRAPVMTGRSELVGQIGVVREALDPEGFIFVHGELWRARTNGESVPPGESVRVEGLDEGLTLRVAPAA